MVDPRNQLRAAFQPVLHAKAFEQRLGADLYAVAQPNGFYLCKALHIAGEHGHGIGVVEEISPGADLLHISGKALQNRNGAQGAHDAPDSKSVGDSLFQTVLLGNLKIGDGAGVVSSHLNGVYNKGCTGKGRFAVFHAQIGADLSPFLVHVFVDGGKYDIGFLQTFLVNIIQRNLSLPQRGSTHAVPQDISRKYRASGSHKCDF